MDDGSDAGTIADRRGMTKALHAAIPTELKDAHGAKKAAEDAAAAAAQ